MTETRTNRHGLPQWGSGSDTGSRADFNEAFDKLNDQAAYDNGATLATLPAADIAGRYALVSLTGDYRTLYRSNDATSWDAIGGNTMPRAFHYRALDGQGRTATAVTFSHPDADNPGATIGYDGSAVLTGTVRVYDDDEPARGVLMIGTDAAASPTVRGRLHVRTRADDELGLVLQPHDAGAGYLFSARNTGGTNVFTVDALGRVQQRGLSAFGGATMPTTSVLAIAPTSSGSDGVTNGVLLHGQAAATGKTILRIQPDVTDDTAPIGVVTRSGIALGRLPWGTPGTTTGIVTLAANTVYVRATGAVGGAYFNLRRSDPTSPTTEADSTKDTSVMTIDGSGFQAALPVNFSQRLRQDVTTLTLYRVGNFSHPFQTVSRLVPGPGGTETVQLAGSWYADGRLATGAWWKSTGVVRDSRQPLVHHSRKVYSAPGTSDLLGRDVASGETYTFTWPAMPMRSISPSDLEILVSVEFYSLPRPDGVTDTNGFYLQTFVSVNGGSYVEVDTTYCTPIPYASTAARIGGDTITATHFRADVPLGATIQLQTRIILDLSIPRIRLRMIDMRAQEIILESYTAA